MNKQSVPTQHKDKIFILVLALVSAGLAYQTIKEAIDIISNSGYKNLSSWMFLIVDALAIYGVLYLINNYRQRQRRISEQEKQNQFRNQN